MSAATIRIGSVAHKELFCQFFLDTYCAFEPTTITWPPLDTGTLETLRSLPFWGDALKTEQATACTIRARAALEMDPLLHHALALQAQEEARHAIVLEQLIRHYCLPAPAVPPPPPPHDPAWAFLRTGYSECFDAFFSFALLPLAQESGLFPASLVAVFEPIMQEEARHILFFVNWEAYQWAQHSVARRPYFAWQRLWGRWLQVWYRLQMARGVRAQGDFTVKGHQAFAMSITPRQFLQRCLQENSRRLERYDARLLRPWLVPMMARLLCGVLP